jgi:hypothetical protein
MQCARTHGCFESEPVDALDRNGWMFWPEYASPECYNMRHYASSVVVGWVLGSVCPPGVILAVPNPLDTLNPGYYVSEVTAGPNTGLWFTDSLTTGLYMKTRLLKDFRSDGDTSLVQVGDSVAAQRPLDKS